MDDEWRREGRTELTVPVHVWVTVKHIAGKKSKKQERTPKTADLASEDSPRRLRERSSWLSMPKMAAANMPSGQWRAATLRVTEEANSATFSLTLEDGELFPKIPLHILSHTDIRPAHRSLFFQPNVIGIHQRLPSVPQTAYILFQDTATYTTCLSLLRSYALPELYGQKRLADYDRRTIGGLYRVWRGVELELIEGRNLLNSFPLGVAGSNAWLWGNSSSADPNHLSPSASGELDSGHNLYPASPAHPSQSPNMAKSDHGDHDIYCELLLDNTVTGKTTLKRLSQQTPRQRHGNSTSSSASSTVLWHESFNFPDLPPYGILHIHVWKVRSLAKDKRDKDRDTTDGGGSAVGGSISAGGGSIGSTGLTGPTGNPTLGATAGSAGRENTLKSSISGSVSLMSSKQKDREPVMIGRVEISLANFRRGELVDGWWSVISNVNGFANGGELKLKIKVDEEIILPSQCYIPLFKVLNHVCLYTNSSLSHLAKSLSLISISASTYTTSLLSNIAVAIAEHNSSPNTLFRGNTTLTKTIEFGMQFYGREFLEASLGTVIKKFVRENVYIEVDVGHMGSANRRAVSGSGNAAGGGMMDGGGNGDMGSNTNASNAGGLARELEANVKVLVGWCEKFWDQIYQARADCPNELRVIFQQIRSLVDQKWGGGSQPPLHRRGQLPKKDYSQEESSSEEEDEPQEGSAEGDEVMQDRLSSNEGGTGSPETERRMKKRPHRKSSQGSASGSILTGDHKDLKWQSISAFIFLRFFVPAILNPHLFGLVDGMPNNTVQRSLRLVAKVLQSLANLNMNVHREEHMRGVKTFLRSQSMAMVDYLWSVSNPLLPTSSSATLPLPNTPANTSAAPSPAIHTPPHIVDYRVRDRLARLPQLHREALQSTLPRGYGGHHGIDSPKELAVIASTVVRNKKGRVMAINDYDEFERVCFEIEGISRGRAKTLLMMSRGKSASGRGTAGDGDGRIRRGRSTDALRPSTAPMGPSVGRMRTESSGGYTVPPGLESIRKRVDSTSQIASVLRHMPSDHAMGFVSAKEDEPKMPAVQSNSPTSFGTMRSRKVSKSSATGVPPPNLIIPPSTPNQASPARRPMPSPSPSARSLNITLNSTGETGYMPFPSPAPSSATTPQQFDCASPTSPPLSPAMTFSQRQQSDSNDSGDSISRNGGILDGLGKDSEVIGSTTRRRKRTRTPSRPSTAPGPGASEDSHTDSAGVNSPVAPIFRSRLASAGAASAVPMDRKLFLKTSDPMMMPTSAPPNVHQYPAPGASLVSTNESHQHALSSSSSDERSDSGRQYDRSHSQSQLQMGMAVDSAGETVGSNSKRMKSFIKGLLGKKDKERSGEKY
ncbi:hypothetical protein FRC03_005558 [Tulasnella sp. 419]|nr:hypothetical protein FRC03_005558 [Tulasnella sp. 419]